MPDTGHSMMIVRFWITLRLYTTFDSSIDGGTERYKTTETRHSKTYNKSYPYSKHSNPLSGSRSGTSFLEPEHPISKYSDAYFVLEY